MFFSKSPPPTPPVEPTFPQGAPYIVPGRTHSHDELHKQIEHLTRIAVRTETRLCMLIERMGIKGIIN